MINKVIAVFNSVKITLFIRLLLYPLKFGEFYFHIDRNVVGVGEVVVDDDILCILLVAILLSRNLGEIVTWLHDMCLASSNNLILSAWNLSILNLGSRCFFYWSFHLRLHYCRLHVCRLLCQGTSYEISNHAEKQKT